MGGNSGKARDTVYKYEPETGHWTLMPYRLSTPTYAMPAFLINRKAFQNTK